MKEIYKIVKENILFNGISEDEFISLTDCIEGKVGNYEKGQEIIDIEENIDFLGLIIRGKVQIIKEDYAGNNNIIAEIGIKEMFGETFGILKDTKSTVRVIAIEKSEILFLSCEKIFEFCSENCSFHNKIIKNLVIILAKKNIILNKKVQILSERSMREKILAFLNEQKKDMNNKIIISYNRQEMADYLCVDRSALSKELSKMKKDKIIDYNKNIFEILFPR